MRPRTKHLNIKYHHFREEVRKGTISIYHTRREEQIADIFTKPLPEAPFTKFREKMMGSQQEKKYLTYTLQSTPTHPPSVHISDQLNQKLSHSTFNDPVEEYMHWHYHLNHASFPVMYHMAKTKLLSQYITSVLQRLHK